jgi:hypothetical protein
MEHGESLARTMRALGYPKGRETLLDMLGESGCETRQWREELLGVYEGTHNY